LAEQEDSQRWVWVAFKEDVFAGYMTFKRYFKNEFKNEFALVIG